MENKNSQYFEKKIDDTDDDNLVITNPNKPNTFEIKTKLENVIKKAKNSLSK